MKNSCKITFEGLNVAALLTALCRADVKVLSVERSGKKCAIQVPSSCERHTIAILKERCYNILGIEFFGWANVKRILKKRFVLPLICLLAVTTLAVSSQFCLKIDVTGDFDPQTVCEALLADGIKLGANLRKSDLNAVQNDLTNKLGAMYATVTRSGSVLYVNAVAKKTISPPLDMRTARDIVATRSGTVTSIVCEQGTPLVKVGDTVSSGDVLIRGKRVFNDGVEEDVYALGRVTLQLTATGFAQFDGTRVEVYETGNTFKATGVVIFGKEYIRPCPFEQYVKETTVTNLFPLNLKICKNIFRETKTRRVPATMDQCMDELKRQAYSNATEVCDFEIVRCEYMVLADGVSATLYGEIKIE